MEAREALTEIVGLAPADGDATLYGYLQLSRPPGACESPND